MDVREQKWPLKFYVEGFGAVTAYRPTGRGQSYPNLQYASPAKAGKAARCSAGVGAERLTEEFVRQRLLQNEERLEGKKLEPAPAEGAVERLPLKALVKVFMATPLPIVKRGESTYLQALSVMASRFTTLDAMAKPDALRRWKMHRLTECTGDTVRKRFGPVRAFVEWCERERYLPEGLVNVPSVKKSEKGRARQEGELLRGRIPAGYLSYEMVRAILAELPEDTRGLSGYYGKTYIIRDRFELQYELALRSELVPRLRNGQHYGGGSHLVNLGPIDKSGFEGDHPLTIRAKEILDERRAVMSIGPIFAEVNLRGTWRSAVKRALPSEYHTVQINHLRSWRLTHAAMQGMKPVDLQRLGRHKSLATTNKYLKYAEARQSGTHSMKVLDEMYVAVASGDK